MDPGKPPRIWWRTRRIPLRDGERHGVPLSGIGARGPPSDLPQASVSSGSSGPCSPGRRRGTDRRPRSPGERKLKEGVVHSVGRCNIFLRTPPRLHDRHRGPGLLLRSAESLATRDEREHERAAPAILSEGHRSVPRSPAHAQPGRRRAQRPTPEDTGVSHPGGSLSPRAVASILEPATSNFKLPPRVFA